MTKYQTLRDAQTAVDNSGIVDWDWGDREWTEVGPALARWCYHNDASPSDDLDLARFISLQFGENPGEYGLARPVDRRRLSLDNGQTYDPAAEQVVAAWDEIVNVMDDEIRERVSWELAPCDESEFLARYLELSAEDLVVG